MENIPLRQLPIQISQEEIEIINDIRKIDFGRITVNVQNGVIISKEVTTIVKNSRNKNSGLNCAVARRTEELIVLAALVFTPFLDIYNISNLF